MIQFNLLPDVKIQFIKAKKAKRMVIAISALAMAVSISILVVMVSATYFQKNHIKELDKDIKSYENSISSTSDISKILTIQNQLETLPTLYSKRLVTSRVFGYVQSTTPTQVSIENLRLDFTGNTIVISGTADSLESVNRYVDTLKFTTYSVKDSTDKPNAFTDVILTSFGRDNKSAQYSVGFGFDPTIFDSSKEITLAVPQTITTRSETQLPSSGVFDTNAGN